MSYTDYLMSLRLHPRYDRNRNVSALRLPDLDVRSIGWRPALGLYLCSVLHDYLKCKHVRYDIRLHRRSYCGRAWSRERFNGQVLVKQAKRWRHLGDDPRLKGVGQALFVPITTRVELMGFLIGHELGHIVLPTAGRTVRRGTQEFFEMELVCDEVGYACVRHLRTLPVLRAVKRLHRVIKLKSVVAPRVPALRYAGKLSELNKRLQSL